MSDKWRHNGRVCYYYSSSHRAHCPKTGLLTSVHVAAKQGRGSKELSLILNVNTTSAIESIYFIVHAICIITIYVSRHNTKRKNYMTKIRVWSLCIRVCGIVSFEHDFDILRIDLVTNFFK